MLEDRVGQIKEHMVQLIQMVAKTNQAVNMVAKDLSEERKLNEERHQQIREEFKAEFSKERKLNEERFQQIREEFKAEFSKERKLNEERHQQLRQEFKAGFSEERKINEERHKELLKEIRNNNVEVDYLREKISKHDMAIHKLNVSN